MPASHESSQKSGVKRARSVSPTPDAANTGGASKTQKNRSVTKTGRSNSSVTNGSRPGSIAHERSEPTTFVRQQFMGPAGSGYFNAPEYGRDSSRNNYALDPVIEQSNRGSMGSMGIGMGMGTGMFPSVFDDANEYVDVGPSSHGETADRSKNRVTFGDIAQTEDGGLMHDDIAEPEDRAGDDFKSGDGPSTAIDRQPFDLNYTSGFWSVSSCFLEGASELITSHMQAYGRCRGSGPKSTSNVLSYDAENSTPTQRRTGPPDRYLPSAHSTSNATTRPSTALNISVFDPFDNRI
jgi:hypothetical protein